jgi:hypothetical protein
MDDRLAHAAYRLSDDSTLRSVGDVLRHRRLSGGALTGLLFVVVAPRRRPNTPATERGLSAFTTPSIFHFVVVMAIAALVTMPRRGLASLSVMLGLCALVGGTVTSPRCGAS